MEIHKVKPIHSWRDFLKELGTIVLGICIALAGEEALVWNHWRIQVQQARAAIASELTYNLVGAIAHMRSLDCVEQRLNALSKILDDASRTGSLPPLGNIGGPVRHAWRKGAWDSVVASQIATHFPSEEMTALGAIYQRVQRNAGNAARETAAWSILYTMVGPGRRLDPGSETALRNALSDARDAGRTETNVGRFFVYEVAAMHLAFTVDEREQIAEIKKRPLTEFRQPRDDAASMATICTPIGAVPPNYGEAPAENLPERMRDFVKSLPNFDEDAP
jgi:hypothetical protein